MVRPWQYKKYACVLFVYSCLSTEHGSAAMLGTHQNRHQPSLVQKYPSRRSRSTASTNIPCYSKNTSRRSNGGKNIVFPWQFNSAAAEEEDVSPTVAAAAAQSSDAELQRYQNRATLAERVLRDKISQGELLRSKLQLLQDVVRQLQASAAQDVVVVRCGFESERQTLEQELQQMHNVTLKLNQSQAALVEQAEQYQTELVELQTRYQREQLDRDRGLKDQQEKEREYQLQIEALQREVLEMDQSLESTQQESIDRQRQSRILQDEMSANLLQEQRKVELLKDKLRDAEDGREQVLQQLQNQTNTLSESVLVATAAVSSAERREAAMSLEWKELMSNHTLVKEENDLFRMQLDGRLQEQEGAGNDTVDKLDREVSDLQEQIRSLCSTHAAQQRMDKKTAQEQLARLRAEYEEKLLGIDEQRQRYSSSDSSPRRASMRRRLWQRVKGPFQRK